MKTFSIISGDKRQFYIKEYLKNHGYNAEIITNMDFNNTDFIVAGTPFVKNSEYINCDYYTGFPVDTFLGLLKPKQIVFAGSISEDVMNLCPKDIKLIDVLRDEDVVWSNAMLTAEGLIGEIIKNTDFSLNNSKVLILGFGKCGTNIASRLFNLNCDVSIYDHTKKHLSQAASYEYKTLEKGDFSTLLNKFDIIINTVPEIIFSEYNMSLLKKSCVLFEIAGYPYGFDKKLSEKYGISLITCPGLPGKTAPKAAGELIAKSIISYLKQKGLG